VESSEQGRPLAVRAAVRTDPGRVRRSNEDASGCFPDLLLFAVADGMGGHAGGQVASALTIETLRHSLLQVSDDDLTPIVDANGNCSVSGRRLVIALHEANDQVLQASHGRPELHGMGTTVAALLFEPAYDLVAVCHVGDSRVYRIRAERIEQLTEDHTVVQQLVREGKMAAEEVRASPQRHMLTQAVGVEPLVSPALRLEKPVAGDVFVITSDGIHDQVEASDILAAVRETVGDIERACERLIALANERGGKDNSTVLIVACDSRSGPIPTTDDSTLAV